MAIEFATQEQIEAVRNAAIKAEKRIQQYVQGSVNQEYVDSAYNDETDDLLDELKAAVDDVVAATDEGEGGGEGGEE